MSMLNPDGTINLDFGNVDSYLIPDGTQCLVRCDKVEVDQKKEPGSFPYLRMHFSVVEGEHEGKTTNSYIASLAPKSRYFLQQMLESLTGRSWADDSMKLDPRELPGLTAYVTITNEAYTNKDGKPAMSNKISAWHPKPGSNMEASSPMANVPTGF